MRTKAIKTHLLRAENPKSTWTLGEITAYRSSIHRLSYKEENRDLVQEMIDTVNEGGFSITREQSDFGISWLRNAVCKKNGDIRNSKLSKCFGSNERRVIFNFTHFTFEGVRTTSNSYSGYVQTTPIYRVHAKCGDFFDYTMEFGALPEVTYTSYKATKYPALRLVAPNA